MIKVIGYIIAGICLIWGILYLIAAAFLGEPINLAGYTAIGFWVTTFFALGLTIIFFLRKPEQTPGKTEQPKEIHVEQRIEPPVKHIEPLVVEPKQSTPILQEGSLDFLKLRYALGEITKEEFEQMKKEIDRDQTKHM
jgi:hypothetical protein